MTGISEAMARIAMLVCLWAVVDPGAAAAQTEVPIIEGGREAEVLELFAPYELGREVRDGYRLMNVDIDVSAITCELVGPDDDRATLLLMHPELAERSELETESFAVELRADAAPGRAALRALYRAVRDNDDGSIYRRRARTEPATIAGVIERSRSLGSLRDGLLWCGAILIGFMVLLGRELGRGARSLVAPILALTAVGAILRVAMSPATMLGAWPFSRTSVLMRLVWNSPSLAFALDETSGSVYYFDLATLVTFVFAILTPGAVFLHAKNLLVSERAALLSAAIVTFLPIHLRFSQSEVAFIPSIVLSSFTFVLVHTALKDESRWFRIGATALLPIVAGAMFITRPLNQIFLPLLLWTALYLTRHSAALSRRLLVAAVVTVVGVLTFFYETVPIYSGQIADGMSFQTITKAFFSLLVPSQNTLLNPWVTPPGLLLLAAGGAWVYTRRAGPDRERGVFLLFWLLLFYVAHAYVIPPTVAMQARYHLHLVVPFAMLASLAMAVLYTRRRAIFWLAAIYVAATPLMHSGFVGDVAFDDLREYAFVREAAEEVPSSCTVLEYTGPGEADVDTRFDRAGQVLDGRTERRLFASIPIGAPAGQTSTLRPEVRALLEAPPPCLYYYEGLFCQGRKAPGERIARACDEMHGAARLEEVSSTSFPHRVYDFNVTMAVGEDRDEPLVLTLYRVLP